MNKIYRTVYNETTNTWVAVEETAKSHRKSSGGVVDSTPTSACERVSGSLKLRGLTAAVAIALLSPLAVSPAFAVPYFADGMMNEYSQIGGGDTASNTVNSTGDTVWGENNTVSSKSTVFGANNKASGQYSTAFGNGTTVTANQATAFGTGTKAGSSKDACIIGNNLPISLDQTACTSVGGTWQGGFGVSGKGANATAWGLNTIAGNNQATAFGSDNKAYGVNSSILGGEGNEIGQFDDNGNLTGELDDDKSYNYGTNAAILGGSSNKVSGENAVAWGEGSQAFAKNSTAFGAGSKAEGVNSLAALGGQANAINSIAMGLNAVASGSGILNATDGTLAKGDSNTEGQPVYIYSEGVGSPVNWVVQGKDGEYYNVDRVTGKVTTKNTNFKTMVDNNGDIGTISKITRGDGSDTIAIGSKSFATAKYSAAFGYGAVANGVGYDGTGAATAIGSLSFASGSQAVALGSRARAENKQSIAVGNDARATGMGSITIGADDSDVNGNTGYNNYDFTYDGYVVSDNRTQNKWRKSFSAGNASTAIATHAQALTQGSTAIGVGATAGEGDTNDTDGNITVNGVNMPTFTPSTDSIEATAIGAMSVAQKAQSTALGHTAEALAAQSTAVGSGATALGEHSSVLGYESYVANGATDSVAIGSQAYTIGEQSLTIGLSSDKTTQTLGDKSIAIGIDTQANANNSIAIGNGAEAGKTKDNAAEYKKAYEEAYKEGVKAARKNNHTPTVSELNEIHEQALNAANEKLKGLLDDEDNPITYENAIAIGNDTRAYNKNAIAIGYGGMVTGENSIVIGDPSINAGDNSSATGNNNGIGKGSNNVAIVGNHNQIGATATYKANGELDRDAGLTVTTPAQNAAIIGNNSYINSNDTYIIGSNVNATEDGTPIADSVANSVYLGSKSAYVGAVDDLSADDAGSTAGLSRYATNAKDIKAINEIGKETDVAIKAGSLKFAGSGMVYTYTNSEGKEETVAVTAKKETEDGKEVTNYYATVDGAETKIDASKVQTTGVVTVGAPGAERRIQNVAAGLIDENSTDAINGSQLFSVIQNLKPETTPVTPENGVATYTVENYFDKDGNPLTKNEDGTYANADGSPYTGDVTTVNNGNKLVTAGDVVNTINNVYWNIDAKGDGNNAADPYQITAGKLVDLVGDGILIDQERLSTDGNGNEVTKVTQDDGTEKWYQVKLDDEGNKVADKDKEVQAANVKDTAKFTFKAETKSTQIKELDGLANLPDPYDYNDKDGKPVTITNADGSPYTGGNVVKKDNGTFTDDKGNPLTMTGADGKPYTEVPNIIDNSTKFVTAGDVRDTINNVYWNIDAKGDGNNAADPYQITAGKLVDLVGDGILIDQERLSTDGNGNEVIKVTQDDGTEKWYQVKLDDEGNKVADKDKEVQAANVKDTAKFTFKAETAQQPVVYTDAEGNKLTKNDAGDWVKPKVDEDGEPVLDADGNPTYETVQPADVIASMNNGDNSTVTPMTLDNIASNLEPSTSDGVLIAQDGSATFNGKPVTKVGDKWVELDEDGKPTTTEVKFKDDKGNSLAKPSTEMKAPTNALAMNNKAATVGDVLNAGWNLRGNGDAVDFVKPYDTVNFINGAGTTATVTSDGLTSKVSFDVGVDNKTTQITYVDAGGNPVVRNGDDWYKADDIGEDGEPKDGTSPVDEKNVSSQVVAKTTPLPMEQDSSKKPTGKVETPTDTDTGLATAAGVANAINNSGWKVSGSNSNATATGDANGTPELINPGDNVAFVAGKGLKLDQETTDGTTTFTFSADIDQDGNSKTKLTSEQTKVPTAGDAGQYGNYTDGNIQLALKHDNDSDTDTFDVKLNNNVTLGDKEGSGSLNVSDKKDGDKPVANTEIKPNEINFTDAGGDNNAGKITGLAPNFTVTDGNTETAPAAPTTINNAATVGDVLNAGWNLQAEDQAVDFVTHGDTVNFASSDKSVTIKSTTGSTIDFVVNKAENHEVNDNGTDNGTVFVPTATAGDDGKTPTQFWDATQTANAINAAGWNVSGNNLEVVATGTANGTYELINPGDNVAFVAGKGLKLDQTTADGTTTFTFSADITDGGTQTTVTNGDDNVKVENTGAEKEPIYEVSLNNVLNVGSDNPIEINGDTGDITLGGDTGGNINNVANHINPDGSMIDDKAPTNQAATVQDVLNSGWNVKVGDADPEYIKHGDTVKFVDGQGTKVSGSKDGIAYDINVDENSPLSINEDGALTVNVGGFDNTTDGSVNANNPNGLATAGDVANAVNNSGWNVTTSASTGEVSGTSKKLIKPTNTVTFDAGDNIRIVQSGNQISVGTTRNINVAGNLNVAGDTTVGNLAVNPNSNVDMGGNQIHNVATGTAPTDAVNVAQLRQEVANGGQDWNPRINQVENHANAGTAQAIATAGLPQVYLPGKNLIAIGGGVYRGESGYAVGFSSISDNGSWIFKATGSGNSRGNFGGSAAVGYQW
ncbi:MAG: YadA-like family protein [Neisseriaceae bacterium]|nr:YadA-like family protein [Neisseriaceae bacterium]